MKPAGNRLDDIVLSATEFIDAWAAHEQESARLALAARRLEACGEWAHDGSVSITAWLRHHCRMSNRDAASLVHRGRFLDRFAIIAEAACGGVLSAGQITALRSVTTPAVEPILAAQQSDFSRTADGLVGRFVLDEFGAAQFEQAIRVASTWDGTSDTRESARRSADALVDVCAFFNANHDKPGTPRQRPHVELMAEADTLDGSPVGWTTDHASLSAATTATLLCDCVIHRVMRAGSAVLSYGRATRSVPPDLFRATAVRDGGCRFPGCDRKVAWCDAHHIHYWQNLGLTELENLVLLCNRHHHLVHRLELHLKLLPSGDLEVIFAGGTTGISQPRGLLGGRSP